MALNGSVIMEEEKENSMTPVVVCTERGGVIFGYAKKDKPNKKGQIKLKRARMCLYWPASVGGVFGLGEKGPDAGTKVSAELGGVLLEGVTAIFDVTKEAQEAWKYAPIQGRE